MQKILTKRVFRDLRANLFRYLALMIMIMFCMFIVVALIVSAESVMKGTEKYHDETFLENGQFTTFIPLTENDENGLEELGAVLEQHFSMDYDMEDNSVLRVMKVREKIDLLHVNEGRIPVNENEIAIDPRYKDEHDLVIGDILKLGDESFEITGIVTTADYDSPMKEFGDTASDSVSFGISFVSEKAYEKLLSNGQNARAEVYLYAYRITDNNITDNDVKEYMKDIEITADQIDDEYFKEYWDENAGRKDEYLDGIDELLDGARELKDGANELKTGTQEFVTGAGQLIDSMPELKEGTDALTEGISELDEGAIELYDGVEELRDKTNELVNEFMDVKLYNMQSFRTAEDNSRISSAANDQVINLYAGMFCGVLIIIMFAYVISVFVVHGIEKESSVIGALYALGVKRKQLMLHYITLPVVIIFLASLIGTLLGASKYGAGWQLQDVYGYFSVPVFDIYVPSYLLIYGIVMPPLIAAIVNVIVIRNKLSRTALSLIRNEQKASKVSTINIKGKSFVNTFKLRQMIRELRSGLTVVFGMFVTLLLLMIALNCLTLCLNVKNNMVKDAKYEYMYTYKYPEKEVPIGGEAAFAKALSKETLGYKFNITIMGIDNDNPYFDAKPEKGMNKVVISNSIASKFGLKKGDKLIVTDEENERDYAFDITDITEYSTSMYAFMDIESMRELFEEDEDYFNTVFSDKELDIPSGRLFATTTKQSIERASDVFINNMWGMVIMIMSCSIAVFIIVMYLMMKVMIDRSSFNISLIKIFGYKKNEIRKLYLDGNFYFVALGALVCIPLAKLIMDRVYPYMVANVGCDLNITFPLWEYLLIYGIILVLYFIINNVLVINIGKILPAEVLKNRE